MTIDSQKKSQYFKKRNTKRIGEQNAEKWMNYHNIKYIRYGIDALDSNVPLWKVPIFIRSAPDFIAFKMNTQFLEAKSFKYIIKVKIRDLEAYKEWNKLMKLYVLFYDIIENCFLCIALDKLVYIIENNPTEIASYPESKTNTYYIIEKKWLPTFKKL